MSNGARHGLGVVAGLVATPVIFGGLLLGSERMQRQRLEYLSKGDFTIGLTGLTGILVLLVTAVVIGVLTGSRLSPLASLIPGGLLALYSLPWMAKPVWTEGKMPDLPSRYENVHVFLVQFGILFLIGALLAAASLPLGRWRGRPVPAAMGRHVAPGHVGPPPPPGAMPGAPPMAPQYGRQQHAAPPPPPEHRPGAGTPPSPPAASPGGGGIPFNDGRPSPGGERKQEGAGEWTQMYGGDDLRGDKPPS
ncbi:hypothetical protein [Spirillospora sp. CA-294931]|uniref:hypothetical protein n=1 Tax=Spirillospora sp. CA-294931 TaxID=3240042 RepID=UPI003D8F6DC7